MPWSGFIWNTVSSLRHQSLQKVTTATKMVQDLETKSYEEWLENLDMFSLQKKLREDMTAMFH